MATHKTLAGILMVVLGTVAIGSNYLQNYINAPLSDVLAPVLTIVVAGTLPALLIIFGSIIIWGELEEKRVEKEIAKFERRLVSKKHAKKKRRASG